MKLRRSTFIPLILLVYLAIMAVYGWKQYSAGQMSAAYFFGVIAATLAVIILLHFSLRRRERFRDERQADMKQNDNSKNN